MSPFQGWRIRMKPLPWGLRPRLYAVAPSGLCLGDLCYSSPSSRPTKKRRLSPLALPQGWFLCRESRIPDAESIALPQIPEATVKPPDLAQSKNSCRETIISGAE
jgi:hypothetical protein